MKIESVESSPVLQNPSTLAEARAPSSSDRNPTSWEADGIYQNVVRGLIKMSQHHSEEDPVSPRLFAKMEDTLDRAISLEAEYPGFWIVKGKIHILRGAFDTAIEHFNRAIDLESGFTDYYWSPGDALLGRGWARYFSGDIEGATVDWETAAEMGNEVAKELIKIYQ